MKYDGLLFDLDGTMWDATENIRKSWNIALKEYDELKNTEISMEKLQSVMGLPMDELAARLFPMLSKEKQLQVLETCCKEENNYLSEHGGILYPKLEETLAALSEKCTLCIVSNGQSGYIQSFLKAHGLGNYFVDFQNWGDHKVPKGENIRLVMERNHLSRAAYVGDTDGDATAAAMAGIDFIYARYGFGNTDNDTYVIDAFSELTKLVL